jgi:hypothetical protein
LLRVFIAVVSALIGSIVCAQTSWADQELRIVSRNSLVFVDAVREGEKGAEWAPYRVVDEQRPVIFKVEGPGRVVLKLRTFLEATNREAVGVVLRDGTIVLTARVPGVRDPAVKLVEGEKKRATKARNFVVRLGPGEHTVSVRYSEGPALLVFASFIPGAQAEIAAGEGDVPLVDPRAEKPSNEVQRIGKVTADGEELAHADDEEDEDDDQADPLAASGSLTPEEEPDLKDSEAANALAQREAWQKRRETSPADLGSRSGPELDRPSEEIIPSRREPRAPIEQRTLTQPAPYLSLEFRGGLIGSRLGLDVAPVIGADARFPVPRLDARKWSIGFAVDGTFAQGHAEVLSERTRRAVNVAKITRTAVDVAADLRFVVTRVADLLDPYVGVGGGASFGSINTETSWGTNEETRIVPIGVLRIGAAFGALGSRPFIELRGAVASDDAAISAVAGYRFEILGDAPTE